MTILFENEVLRVTPTGEFIWHEDADRMIEEGDFSHSPAMPFILKALRKREWVGLTDEEIHSGFAHVEYETFNDWLKDPEGWCIANARYLEAILKEKNT